MLMDFCMTSATLSPYQRHSQMQCYYNIVHVYILRNVVQVLACKLAKKLLSK